MKKVINIFFLLTLVIFTTKAQTLEEYMKIAAENNPGLKSKYTEFQAAMKKIPQLGALPDPTLSFGYFISPVETRVGPQKAKISLSQMFPWFGTLEARESAAAAMAQAKYQAFLDARNEIYFKVAAAYYPLYEQNSWKKVEEKNLDILESFRRISSEKFENGNGAMVDVLRVDLLINESETELEILSDKENALLVSFNNLLNRNENEAVNLPDSLIFPLNEPFPVKDSILSGNPVLKELDRKIEASKASETVASKQNLPNFGIGLDYVIVGKRNGVDLSDNGKDVLMPMLSLSIPIFSKRYDAAVEEAALMQESYRLRKQDMINSLNTKYENVRFNLKQYADKITLYEKQVEENRRIIRLLLTAYSNSGNDFEDLLDVQQKLLKYEKMLATAKVQYNIAYARLNYITAKNYQK